MGAKLIVLGNRFEKRLLQNVYLNNTYKLLYEYHSYVLFVLQGRMISAPAKIKAHHMVRHCCFTINYSQKTHLISA